MVKVSVTGGATDSFPLTFNSVKNVPGMYEHRNGDVLIVATKNSVFTRDANMRTGYTRAGHLLWDKSAGRLRKTANDKSPDGIANYRKFAGVITLKN